MAIGKDKKVKNKDLEKRKKEAMKMAKKYLASGGGRTMKQAMEYVNDPYEGLEAQKRGVAKMQKEFRAPSTFIKGRVSRKEDKLPLEGGQLSEGTGIRMKGGGVRKMTESEAKEARRAADAKYHRDKDQMFRANNMVRNIRQMEALKEMAEKKKKKKKK